MPRGEKLKPHEFQKGKSGNPNGRPLGARNRKTIYRQIADMTLKDLGIDVESIPSTTDAATATAIQMFRRAIIAGDVAAAKEVMDSAFEKVTDKIDLTGDMQHEFTVNIVNKPADGR
jgi:glycine cleavage system regulatory protein